MRYLLLIILFSTFKLTAQVDHWESVILPGDSWSYKIPTSQPDQDWNQLGFNDSFWEEGISGFGYGDDDDATIISNTMSIYIRTTFDILDISSIESVLLDIDYDDGFVAFINGHEVARNLMTGTTPDFNQPSDGWHEALLPQGYVPERFAVETNILNSGANVIAVQVHNYSLDSSDMTALPVLSFGINNNSNDYRPPPSWFVEPSVPNEINFESSNLPIVLIQTVDGQGIPNEPKIDATMQILFRENGDRNYLTDINDPDAVHFSGDIKIEVRGSTSSTWDKKPYAFTPYDSSGEKINVSFLGMPKENDWILNGIAYDPSFMRDYLSYNLSNLIGNYASRTRYCELFLNGEFRGIYIFQEKLKADDSRIDIRKIDEDDTTLPQLSGGYITKTDKIAGADVVAWSMDNYGGWQSNFVHEHPKSSTIALQQHDYIKNQFETLQSLVDPPSNNTISEGFPSLIDNPSFVDFMIINELASNVDAYEFSTFFHKDRNGKLRAGPVWDFNLTFGNDLFSWGYDRSHTDIWQFFDGNMGPKFWKDLFDDSVFNCYLTRRWQELTSPGMPLALDEIYSFIDETKILITEAVERQESINGTSGVFDQEILDMKSWISDRMNWISNQLTDVSLCENVTTPPLVISKINYNPLVSPDLDSSDFEFLELSNNSSSTINLSGIYFGGLGLSYQFPQGSFLLGDASLFLANETSSFIDRYGFEPYGEFTRSLSNDGEDLILMDAFGNIVDEVVYNDVLPWPEEADGQGSFLKLISLDLDNSLASSWVAQEDNSENLSMDSLNQNSYISIYPNPFTGIININSNLNRINIISLMNLKGQLIQTFDIKEFDFQIDFSDLSIGIYILQIQTEKEILVKKILKN